MMRQRDENFKIYSMMDEKVEIDKERKWVELKINKKEKW